MPAETHSHTNPVSREDVIALIRDQLSEILEIDPDRVELTSAFVDDLGADSLALIELVEALEGELGERSVGFRIDDEDLEDLRTVGDAVDYILARLGT
ncbi:MAG TPA: acyl carrier protein [Acidimicrobiales bacterium]|nr:acyl carrier protein [Acidimicrobiales bacterium]